MTSATAVSSGSPAATELGWLAWAIPAAWLALLLAGQPAPHPDDLFFGGAAIHLAETGQWGNPWISNWLQDQFQTDKFYVQLPYHTWLQSCWLRLSGVSGFTLRAFALFGSSLGALALADAVLRSGAGRKWAAVACVIWAAFILNYGLRADSLGLGLIGAGHLLLVRNAKALKITGLWLAGLGAASHPFALAVAVPVVATHLGIVLAAAPAAGRTRVGIGAVSMAVIGASVVVALGVLLIHGETAEFLRVFKAHSILARPGTTDRWRFFSGQFLLGQEWLRRLPFAVCALVLIVAAAVRSHEPRRVRLFVAGLVAFAVLGYVLYAQYLARYLVFTLLLGLPVATMAYSPARRRILAPMIVALIFGAIFTDFIALYGRSLRPPISQCDDARRFIARAPQAHVVLDEFSIRLLYDFRPPANTRDWQIGRPAGGRPLGFPIAAKPADELWVVNTYKLAHSVSGLSVSPRYLSLAGRTLHSLEIGSNLSVVP